MDYLTAIIIDDESKARQLLSGMLNEYCPSIGEVQTCSSAIEGIEVIKKINPDLMFLDINMPGMNGFEMLDKLESFNGKIIFTTAYDEHAIKAIKYNAFDYLLKPIHVSALEETIKRVEKVKEKEIDNTDLKKLFDSIKPSKDFPTSIAINDRGGLLFIKTDEILFLKAQGNYTTIQSEENEFVSTKTIRNFEEMLDENIFIRVHKSYIVNINYVERFSNEDGGELDLKGGYVVPVSRRKRQLLERFSV